VNKYEAVFKEYYQSIYCKEQLMNYKMDATTGTRFIGTLLSSPRVITAVVCWSLIEPDVGSTAHMVGAQMSKLRTRLRTNSYDGARLPESHQPDDLNLLWAYSTEYRNYRIYVASDKELMFFELAHSGTA
jgi:hypothetical protein